MNKSCSEAIADYRSDLKKVLISNICHKLAKKERVNSYQVSESTPVNHQEIIDYLQTAIYKVKGVKQPRLNIQIGCTVQELVDAFLEAETEALGQR